MDDESLVNIFCFEISKLLRVGLPERELESDSYKLLLLRLE